MGNTLNKEALVKQLTGHDLTCGWDMVCCYQQKTLNEMLAKQYISGKLVNEISVKEEIPAGFLPGNVLYEGKIMIKSPTIQFTQDERCKVEMLIKSGAITERFMKNPTKEIIFTEDQYKISGTIQLSAVSGAMESVDAALNPKTATPDSIDTHPANTVIAFNGNSQGDKMYVYLDFSTTDPENDFRLKSVEKIQSKDEDAYLLTRVEAAVNKFFQTEMDSFRYVLGGISSIPSQYKNSLNLFPRSCLFCSQKNADQFCLNIYLQVSDSLKGSTGSYEGHTGISKPQFPDPVFSVFPLPENTSAAIAISKSLLLELYIRNTCKKNGWSANIDSTYKEGFKYLLSNAAVTIKADDIHKGKSVGNIFTSSNHNGFNIDFKNVPIELTFKELSGKFSWKHTSNISYNDTFTSHGSGSVVNTESYEGDFSYTISCDKNIDLSRVGQDQFKISFSLNKSEFELKSKIQRAVRKRMNFIVVIPIPTTVDDKEHCNQVISALDSAVKPVLPDFSFDFGQLNLFFAANLLFPGKHTFTIAEKNPFGFPSDMMVFGSIGLPD